MTRRKESVEAALCVSWLSSAFAQIRDSAPAGWLYCLPSLLAHLWPS